MNKKRLIGLTMGDPAGVGPEICLRVMSDPEVLSLCTPILFGDVSVLLKVANQLGLPCPDALSLEAVISSRQINSPLVCDLGKIQAKDVQVGRVQPAHGRAAFCYIETAIRAAQAGLIAAVVTAPINKVALNLAGIMHPGHTEIFTAITKAHRSCMLLTDETISCSFVTTHTAYAQVPGKLTRQRVLDVIELTAKAMSILRGHPARIAVCGLNPHAGEHGLFGDEEAHCIEPAIVAARGNGLMVEGTIPPDAAFLPSVRKRIDAYVCMYHDQGHIPFKMLAFDTGVNITLGLPIIRTSVDHGTAFDIAWQGKANPASMIQAIQYAVRLTKEVR